MEVVRNSRAVAGPLTIVLNNGEFNDSIFAPVAFTALMLVSFYTFADDEVSQAGTAQQHKMMDDCMKKYASEDSRMTKGDLEKACKEEMKSQGACRPHLKNRFIGYYRLAASNLHIG
jgi:hypothetical protein